MHERAARALPAQHVEDVGGWSLRRAPGCAWWAGTVQPHGHAGPDEMLRRIVEAERYYAGHNMIARFEISPPACPDGLDTLLAERGYRRESLMSLQVALATDILEQAPAGALRVRLDDRPNDAWFEIWHTVLGHGRDRRAEWDMLDRIRQPSAYASATLGDDVVAVGRAVADTGWVGLFGMATLPEARGKGAARDLITAFAGWAASRADRMYLQVERANPPALRLYERAGFTEIAGYHYRAGE
ncbi:GNAT family N-acetyltransferase [Actinomadura graeca]|uniref:GNAT family N-acetyltransferase n=1 Tax=Actinomadura graeca TaxID=2750812 RepID=UPI001E4F5DC9|nr:GNAT family N-acetyltransferase [Actinomadura graeca]